jgi:acetyl esterase/lipase
LHGGGFIVPLLPIYDGLMRNYTKRTGVPMVLVDYRVAPEYPHPIPVEDCHTALCWLADNATELGVDLDRIAVMGESAGGGLGAGVALLARDRGGPAVAQQLLIYAMLDDRTIEPDPQLPPEYLVFSYDDNRTGWAALLGAQWPRDAVSPYAAPARAPDLSGLPATYIDVGDLDILRDESIEYARRLMAAGIPTELHVIPGLPHGFDMLAPDAVVTQRVIETRLRRLKLL